MPISTRDVASTAGTKTLLTSAWSTRIVVMTDADIEIFGNTTDTNGIPLTAADGEWNFAGLNPADNLYADGLATVTVIDQASK